MATKIEWATETWNPIVGCTKCSPGCENCYAERMAKRLKGMGIPQYQNVVNRNGWTGEISLVEKALDIPLHWKKPRVIFPVSMGDLFHPAVPFEFVDKIGNIIDKCYHHKFLILTKRPERMADYFSVWGQWNNDKSVWLGTTICNQAEADEKIPILLQIPGKRWLSIEPMLGPVDLNQNYNKGMFWGDMLHRVVIGCESLPGGLAGRFEDGYDEAALSIIKQCKAAGVRVFHKQRPVNGRVSHNMAEWPEKLRVRDEVVPNPPKENK